MLRYLKAAFWARPEIPGLGRVPVNVLFLVGMGILGFGHEAFWFLGAGLETAYLAVLATNDRFRALVDALDRKPVEDAETEQRGAVLASLTDERRSRHEALTERIGEILENYRSSEVSRVLAESNQSALDQLTELHLRLLMAQQSLDELTAPGVERKLRSEIDAVQKELQLGKLSPSLAESKTATLAILEQRLANFDRRNQSLEEIESDLDRIEAQVELARENATMGKRPEAVSANIQLASHLLSDPSWLQSE